MKPPSELTLTIPASIMSVPDLNLIERVILNHIHERPHCSNNDLATLTGLSERGIESTLARLKREGMIRSRGNGPARRLILMFLVEHNTPCGETTNANSHVECGVATNAESHTNSGIQPEPSSNEIPLDTTNTKYLTKELDALTLCLPAGNFNQARTHLASMRRWWSALCQRVPQKQGLADECLRVFDDMIFMLEAGWPGLSTLPGYERDRLIRRLADTDPEPLAQLRQQVEATSTRGDQVDLMRLIGG